MDQEFCLRWNNHQQTLINVVTGLLTKESFCDITLVAEAKLLHAHKVIISACSPYFEAICSEFHDKHPVVVLKDVSFFDMKALLEFMYNGEVNVHQDRLGSLVKTAESLKIKGLADDNGDQKSKSPNKRSRPQSPPHVSKKNKLNNQQKPQPISGCNSPAVDSEVLLGDSNSSHHSDNNRTDADVADAEGDNLEIQSETNKLSSSECSSKVKSQNDMVSNLSLSNPSDEEYIQQKDNFDTQSSSAAQNPSNRIGDTSVQKPPNIAIPNFLQVSKVSETLNGNQRPPKQEVKLEERSDSPEIIEEAVFTRDQLGQIEQVDEQSMEGYDETMGEMDEEAYWAAYGGEMQGDENMQGMGESSQGYDLAGTENFPCPQCGRGYKLRQNLLRHMRLECGKEAQLPCPECHMKFKRKDKFYDHYRRIHGLHINTNKSQNQYY